jgi:hypothetical protein
VSEGYPLLTVPANEAYQLAHIATYIASAIARRRAATGRSRAAFRDRAQAVRDLAGGREAFGRMTNAVFPVAPSQLPQPLDVAQFNAARELLSGGPRWAEVTSLAPSGTSGWAMLGHVPGIGPVGARVQSRELAEALRQHALTRPADELAPWAVTDKARRLPVMPHRVDLPGFVADLDPASPDARAVAAALRGKDQQTDTAIGDRFTGVDLDAPAAAPTVGPAVAPTAAPSAAPDAPQPAHAGGPDTAPGTLVDSAPAAAGVAGTAPATAGGDHSELPPAEAAQPQQTVAPADQQPEARPDARPAPRPAPRRSAGQGGTRTAGGQGGRRTAQPEGQETRPPARQRRGQPATPADTADHPQKQAQNQPPQADGPPAAEQPGTGAQRRAARVKATTRWTYERPAAALARRPTPPAAQPPGQRPGQAPAPGRG